MKLPASVLSGLLFIMLFYSGNCQVLKNKMVEYEFGYPFKAGIYYTFEDFKTNNPTEINYFRVITRASELACMAGNLSDYIEYESGNENIRINGKDIWGYSKRGNVYVTHKNMFYKIIMFGGICYMVALRGDNREDDEVQKPFNAATSEHHALLDVNTGKTYDFRIKYLENLLSTDEEIYEDYLNSNIKKRDRKFIFLKKYNDKHKIYFPVVKESLPKYIDRK
ncbi:MAG: hypothetical protein K8S16_11270 [Bacteroidales bacterium]|nr:hypothetical protein [Bacteroidales bacterium]